MMTDYIFRNYIESCLSNEQLQEAIDKFNEILKKRQDTEREELRQELMENLQKAIGDILHNGFTLYIQNTESNQCTAVYFDPEDIYHIEIE